MNPKGFKSAATHSSVAITLCVTGATMRPKPSLEARANGFALGPRTGQCHQPKRRPSANPAAAPQSNVTRHEAHVPERAR